MAGLLFRLGGKVALLESEWSPDRRHIWCAIATATSIRRFRSAVPMNRTRGRLAQLPGQIFLELDAYIRELRQSGFDTVRLQVQLQKKFSVPLFALIMALISAPFAFLTGSRGAMAGVGVSFGIAIAYWALGQLFEQIGNINQLPAALAAWSPDAIFCLAGVYLMARMRT